MADFAGYRGKGGEVEGTTGGVWGDALADFAGYRGKGDEVVTRAGIWDPRLGASGAKQLKLLPGSVPALGFSVLGIAWLSPPRTLAVCLWQPGSTCDGNSM